eukprot:CAMPEP_0113316924 /NCGR_PEP_ID=MMETSP0010_2-20120614/12019_1 /TAXON_ID=216773 ORGANISM="Corethron hystrix, Strain 308" /NCGR_SAMPLE_ID=MMETSP0010_2 /ASSEMBLY_ACC=CAM_ASM_000155 /LENGTH=480 /DNA_ID=CAMNT_0000173765 /DNA_START=345 /DNA_END=1787 /DNA_ORIENTATION=- /assembly_acc=CAM_ASM_000155
MDLPTPPVTSNNSLLAFSLSLLVLLILVSAPDVLTSSDNVDFGSSIVSDPARLVDEEIEEVERLVAAVVDSSITSDPTVVLAAAVGEIMAGVVSAFTVLLLKISGIFGGEKLDHNDEAVEVEIEKSQFLDEALADSDYFLTRAALRPLLTGVGLSAEVASTLVVLIAAIPNQIIKNNGLYGIAKKKRDENALLEASSDVISLTPTNYMASFNGIDIFKDIIKWLQYDVLVTDFAGMTGLNSVVESTLFGTAAAVSSQFYGDVISSLNDKKEDTCDGEKKVLSTSAIAYLRTAASAGALFGSFDAVRLPLATFADRLLSGAIDSCVGSTNANLCMETYARNNPPGPSSEAQFRAFVAAMYGILTRGPGISLTAVGMEVEDLLDGALIEGEFRALCVRLVSWWSARSGTTFNDATFDGADVEAQFRAAITSLYSFEHAFFEALDRGIGANVYFAEENLRSTVVQFVDVISSMTFVDVVSNMT